MDRFVETFGSTTLSGLKRIPSAPPAAEVPLVIAIHGGTYTSAYFDAPGFSLLDRAQANGIPIISIDRPCYGETTPLAMEQADIDHSAERLDELIGQVYARFGGSSRGVFLIGHSIGGAITLSIAARQPAWPLVGLAVSGVCLVTPPDSRAGEGMLPDLAMISMPPAIKDMVMFGPAGSFDPQAPATSHAAADAPAPRAELVDIVTGWRTVVREVLGKIKVPVHYRQGEFDALWVTNADQVAQLAAALTQSPLVDADLYLGAGHCIDFHHLGAAFQLEQLAFALRCGVMAAVGKISA